VGDGVTAAGQAPLFLSTADPGYAEIKAALIQRTGHHYYADKDDALWERLRRRMRETGRLGTEAYLALLRDPRRGPEEWRALEAAVTIGETFFFRYSEQFEALRTTILPELIERRADERRLRIWSAGCSNGAEAYSLAILIGALLGPARADWSVAIIGTDISEPSLAAARRGVFGAWSLRGLPPAERERWFTETPDRRSFALKAEHREGVRFEHHNLMSLVDGTAPLGFSDFDLVLCRNVLIYFSQPLIERFATALRATLVEDGWLLVGHAEAGPAFAEVLEPVMLPGATVYRRSAEGSWPVYKAASIAPAAPPAWSPLLPPVPILPPAEPAPADHPEADAGTPDAVAEVRRLADLGDLAGARAAARAGLLAEPSDAVLHFYDGLVGRGLADTAEAERAFRRALYLRRDFALAHYHLGLLLLDGGRTAAGRRALANAAHLAAALPADSLVAEGDGLTAGRLSDIARHLIEGAGLPA
jgi:chemotaxis protein methyltransferase CheR